MKAIRVIILFGMLLSLLGCGKKDHFILDGPGSVYVDSEYRTEYANCLPFDENRGLPYAAIAYLGKGDEGEANKDIYINKIFESLSDEKIDSIKVYEYDGDDWFLVISRYRSVVDLKKGEEGLCIAAEQGEAFVVRCNQDITINIFEVEERIYPLSVTEEGSLRDPGENIWDITDIDEILNSNV